MQAVMNPFQISPMPLNDQPASTLNSNSSSPSSFDRLMRNNHESAMAANPSPSPPPSQSGAQSTTPPYNESSDPLPVNANHSIFPSELHSLADQMLAENYFAMNHNNMSFPYTMQQQLSAINPNDPVMEIPADSPPSTQSSGPDVKMEMNQADGGGRASLNFDSQLNSAQDFANHETTSRFLFPARALNMDDNGFKPQAFTRQPPQSMNSMMNFESINQQINSINNSERLDQLRPYITQAALNVYMPTPVRQTYDPDQRMYGPIRPSMSHSEPMYATRVHSALSLPETQRDYIISPTHSSPASEGSRTRIPYRLTPTQNFKPFDPSPTGNSTKLKRYFCEECGKGFTQKGGLINHSRIHRGERPYVCSHPDCGRAFVQKCNLTRHERVHTGEKPYQCPVRGCTKQFNRKHTLSQHLQITHEIIADEESMDTSTEGNLGLPAALGSLPPTIGFLPAKQEPM